MIYVDLTDNDNYIAIQKPNFEYTYFHWNLPPDKVFQSGPDLNTYKYIFCIGPTNLGFWSEE